MKKLIFLSVFIITNLFVNAQNDKKVTLPPAAARAENMTEKMSTELDLSADQKTKVLNINLEKAKQMDINREKTAGEGTREVYEQEKKRIFDKWYSNLSSVLTADQLTKWKKYQEEQNPKPPVQTE